MSILSTIKADVEKLFKGTATDAEKFSAAFVVIFKKSPSALQTVENFVNEAAPVVTVAVTLVDPVAEPVVAAALAIVETGLAAIQASAAAATSGQSLLVSIQNFGATVPQLLTGLAIKNPALKATITKIVNLVVGECKVLIPAIENWVKQIEAATPALAPK